MFSLDAAYAINEKWQLTRAGTRATTAEATQLGQRNASGGAGEAVKEAHLEDIGDTFGVGLRGHAHGRSCKAGLDLLYSKNVNKYPETHHADRRRARCSRRRAA